MPLLFVPALILLLAGPWFDGQDTVGWIVFVAAVVGTILQVALLWAGWRWVDNP